MNNRIKYSIFLLQFFFLSPVLIFAQTYIGASIGYDFFFIPKGSYKEYYHITESANNSCFGLEIKQDISNDFFLSIKGTYSKKTVLSERRGYSPINNAKFKIYQASTELGWYPLRNVYVSAGINFTYTPEIVLLYDNEIRGNYVRKNLDLGGILSAGYQYHNFFAEIYYRRALKNVRAAYSGAEWKSRAIGVFIGYRLKLFDKIKFNGKKVNCPKL